MIRIGVIQEGLWISDCYFDPGWGCKVLRWANVCMYVCPLEYLKEYTSKLREIVCTC